MKEAEAIIRLALKEDIGTGDLTTLAFAPAKGVFEGYMVAKQPGVFCGAPVAERVFKIVDPRCRVTRLAREGAAVKPGARLMKIRGGRAILTAERTALNFLQHMSGIATTASVYAAALGRGGVILLDAALHLLEQGLLQRLRVLHDLGQIVILDGQVFQHSGVVAVAQPEVVVHARVAVLGNGLWAPWRDREGRHAFSRLWGVARRAAGYSAAEPE